MTTEEYLIRRKAKGWKFSAVVAEDAFSGVRQIHPLKQREVKEIVDPLLINRIVIAGNRSKRSGPKRNSTLDSILRI